MMADGASSALALLLKVGGPKLYRDFVNALWERQPTHSDYDIHLDVPGLVDPDPADRPLVERIFAAFCQAKRDQLERDPIFLPGGGWKNVLDSAYEDLLEGFQNNDISRFHYFLSNFGSWKTPTGIEESWFFSKIQSSRRRRRYYEQVQIGGLMRWWESLESNGSDFAELAMPRFGNQSGVRVNGHLITPNSVLSHVYACVIARLIRNPKPLVGEVGGGFGRLCYFLKRSLPSLRYVAFDLPECLCCATYFLMKCFPDQRFLLYGESEMTADSLVAYDFVMQPSFEIEKLPDEAVDLFINENSIGDMPPMAGRFYVEQMCRTARAIWHRNHETHRNKFDNDVVSLINREYPIDRDQFRELIRFCDVRRLAGYDRRAESSDMYWYYFERSSENGAHLSRDVV